jgi:hypothetical protein
MNKTIKKLTESKNKYKNAVIENNKFLDEIGVEYIEEIREMVTFYRNYKDTINEGIQKSTDIKSSHEYISLENKNLELQNHLNELTIKLNNLSNNEKIINENTEISIESIINNAVNEALLNQGLEFDKRFNLYKEEQKLKYISLNDEFEKFKKNVNQELPPTPSSSTENKKINKRNKNSEISNNEKKNKKERLNKNNIIPLPENIHEVIYYRNLKNIDKFKPLYYRKDNKIYLKCCSINYEDNEISNKNNVTCIKCYNTYKISKKENNELYDLFSIILPEHEIHNEKEIFNEIKCNNCNFIDKKVIQFCYKCKKVKKAEIIIPNIFPSENELGYKTVLSFSGETLNAIKYNANIYQTAFNEGVNVYEMKPLIKYIKDNKLMEEKQSNIIINKIIRSHAILHIFNNIKYSSIKNDIERIYFDIKAVSKLDENQWSIFRNNLITKLDNELSKLDD